jgi:hypothetical protein
MKRTELSGEFICYSRNNDRSFSVKISDDHKY